MKEMENHTDNNNQVGLLIKHIKENLFEGYFIEDLNSVVNKLDRTKIGKDGHCGYVAVQIILAGMECLGFIGSGGKRNEVAFNFYYDNYFSKINPKYENETLRKLFRNSLRNGTAHYFFTKAGITITLDEMRLGHLAIGKDGTSFIINVAVSKLYDDFMKSYELFKPDWHKFEKGCRAISIDISNGQFYSNEYVKSLSNYEIAYSLN